MAENCFEYAMRYIYRFPKTKAELIIQLRKKGYKDEHIEKTIAALELKGFIDDRMFTDAYINSEIIRKGKSLFNVKGKLMQKGVDKHIINEVVEELYEEIGTGQINGINKDIEKFEKKGLDVFDIIQKLSAKGYHISLIKKCLADSNGEN